MVITADDSENIRSVIYDLDGVMMGCHDYWSNL